MGEPGIPPRWENPLVPLYLTEAEVAELLSPAEAVDAIEACFRRMAAGSVENRPRYRLRLADGALAVMAAADLELGYAGAKVYAGFRGGARFAVLLFRADAPELVAVIEADKLGQLRTGAASAVAAKHLARSGARSLGLIGCGWQAESQLACIRAALPQLERVVAFCRTPERLLAFCEAHGAEPGASHRDPAACDVVVTVTTSPDPVVRGEWLQAGALVCAVGANDGRRRELDNVVLERAAFVCCDSLEDARLESADLMEPVESGVLDWLEVHELQEVVAGEVRGGRRTTTSWSSSRMGLPPGTWRRPPRSSSARDSRELAGTCHSPGVKVSSDRGRFAERVLHGLDSNGDPELVVIWIERKEGGVWAVGRAVNPDRRPAREPRPEDYVFEGYELGDALEKANEALEDDVTVSEEDGRAERVRPFTRDELLAPLERWFFGRA